MAYIPNQDNPNPLDGRLTFPQGSYLPSPTPQFNINDILSQYGGLPGGTGYQGQLGGQFGANPPPTPFFAPPVPSASAFTGANNARIPQQVDILQPFKSPTTPTQHPAAGTSFTGPPPTPPAFIGSQQQPTSFADIMNTVNPSSFLNKYTPDTPSFLNNRTSPLINQPDFNQFQSQYSAQLSAAQQRYLAAYGRLPQGNANPLPDLNNRAFIPGDTSPLGLVGGLTDAQRRYQQLYGRAPVGPAPTVANGLLNQNFLAPTDAYGPGFGYGQPTVNPFENIFGTPTPNPYNNGGGGGGGGAPPPTTKEKKQKEQVLGQILNWRVATG